ncbi:DNA-binding protein [Flavobacterium coralii]|uniref:DNA-binding protein n=1 Tax=Flavobacterium coralii TaxID=2838017 RepID=UPI000C69AB0E|nr:DNA-binding protein [Flavobacterium sp.]|tara:strand:- start:30191 stop:30490 length:300 start_codon:yes stop_codon:yes gene_type:complete
MEDGVTKEDLRQFGMMLIGTIRKMIDGAKPKDQETIEVEWLKAKVVRKMLDISPGSLQNLRITGKVRFKKVLGSYYYNKSDLTQLFKEDDKHESRTEYK